jgi:hypothetical protein
MKTAIFITKKEASTLLRALNLLVDKEQDTINRTRLYKLLSEVEE